MRLLIALSALLLLTAAAPQAQSPGAPAAQRQAYDILGIEVEGVEEASGRQFVIQASGLRIGEQVQIPGDDSIAEAIRDLFATGAYSDVEIVADNFAGGGVFLLIRVQEEPRLGTYEITGVKKGKARDLKKLLPLLRGRSVRPSDIARSEQVIRDEFAGEGYLNVQVETRSEMNAETNRVDLTFDVDRGERPTVADVRFVGNDAFSDRTLRKRLKNTPERRWWRFWSKETFEPDEFEEDLQTLETYYANRGYYGARVLSDSVYVDGEDVIVQVTVEEGPKYHYRDITFEGNTEIPDVALLGALGLQTGDTYSREKLERALFYSPDHTDVSSLYTDRGYLTFNANPVLTEAPGDSLDLLVEVSEGEIYEFGTVTIAGNTKTKDHVIRRELRTVPGQTHSRQGIERSVRELLQLNYFDQQSLAGGPALSVNDDDNTVDLTYNLTEVGGDQLELSGGYGGQTGLLLQAGVTFNNFSIQDVFKREAWRPLPAGDGQRLSLGLTTNGRFYQSYNLSFTEPWFRGKPNPAGFALSLTQFTGGNSVLGNDVNETIRDEVTTFSSRVFYRQRLKWPDDFFQAGVDLGYRFYDIQTISGRGAFGLPGGLSQEATVKGSITRNSLNSPLFPSSGSNLLFSLEVAPPLPGFIQYHKWRFQNDWYTPITGRLSLGFKADYGYIGSLTGEDVDFQRFVVGGSPLEAGGAGRTYGQDLLFMRGYPLRAISPRRGDVPVGGRILNKYSAEMQLLAVQSPQLQLAPYLFLDAANVYDTFEQYNPADLKRSAGFGTKIFLPILGMVDLSYGYQFDRFLTPNTTSALRDADAPQWRFQFSLGGQ
jgi:outer membrane protein insertion porin family